VTLRLRIAIAGAVVALLLVTLGLIIPRVLAASQIAQVDEQLTEALPRALVLTKSAGTSSPPSSAKGALLLRRSHSGSATSTLPSSAARPDVCSWRSELAATLRLCPA
jgi:hypothetical protein